MMVIKPATGRQPTLREMFERKMFMLGITEVTKVEKLWREEVERRKNAGRVGRVGGHGG